MKTDTRERTPIVVVDDDQGILDSFEVMLGDDYALIMTDNGIDAIQLLRTVNPPLVFLDLKIPQLSGIEVLKWVWENALSTKVVIVTALPQKRYEEIANRFGSFRYLKKPFDVDEIESIASAAYH
jgi:DNA-binding NtrC family response regulator